MQLDLTHYEDSFVIWYRTLDTLERLAVNCWLTRDDTRLIDALRERSERLQRFDYKAVPYRCYQLTFHWTELGFREMEPRIFGQAEEVVSANV